MWLYLFPDPLYNQHDLPIRKKKDRVGIKVDQNVQL